MRQFSATPKNDVGIGLRKIVACSHSSLQCLLVSAVFGTVSSLLIFILVSLIFYLGLALTLACGEMPYIVCALHVQKVHSSKFHCTLLTGWRTTHYFVYDSLRILEAKWILFYPYTSFRIEQF